MKKLLLVSLCFLMLSVTQVYAQGRTFTGTVTDDKNGPLPGATVKVLDLAKKVISAASTDAAGRFSIHAAGRTSGLRVSFVGFNDKFIPLDSLSSNVTIRLIASDASNLNEVVVVGYGTGKKISEIPGSVVVVKATEVQNKPTANILDELQGKVPGLQIYSSSGEPSNTPSIRLNGVGSLGADGTPLFIMDGAPIDVGTVLSLNPQDFEDITVLRDAASTAIYGARAANGVIILTTKRGKVNTQRISVNTQYGVSNLTNNTVREYNSMMNTAQYESFVVSSGIKTQDQLDASLAALPYKPADTKWYKVFFRQNAPTYTVDMNVSGGGDKTTYYISGSYFNQEGLAWGSYYNKYNFRTNVNTTVNKWFQMGVNLVGAYEQSSTNPYGSNQINRGLSELLLPYYSNKDKNGVEYPNLMAGSNRYNPKYLASVNPSPSNSVDLNPTGYMQITPVKGLTIKTNGAIEFYDNVNNTYDLPSDLRSLGKGTASWSLLRSASETITNTAEYKFTVAQHNNLTVLAGQEFINYDATGFVASNTGFTDDRLLLLQDGSSTGYSASSSKDQYAFLSYFGRLDYNFDSKYFLNVSTRDDQSSRFGANNKNALFYAVGASWSAKKEAFLTDVKWLNDLVIKASIGTSGNAAIGDYTSLAVVGNSTAYNGNPARIINNPGNPNLSWEKQRQINVGFQATVFDKFHIDAEYFDRLTTSMLFSEPYAFISGFSNVEANIGGLSNKGVNANITIDVIQSNKGFLSVYGNLGYVQQKVTSLFNGQNSYTLPNTGITYVVGQPVSYYDPIFAYVDPATGNPLWYVPGKDFTKTNKDPNNLTTNFDPNGLNQNTGIKEFAPLNGGFGFNGGYQGFSIAADFTYSSGKYLTNNDEYFFNNPYSFGSSYDQSTLVTDYWKKPGDIARYPKAGTQFTQFDSRLIENASFIRLKNLTFAYSLPKSWLGKSKVISGLKFFVTCRNLITFTKYPGPDPEDDTNVSLGIDPNTRQTVAGINLQL